MAIKGAQKMANNRAWIDPITNVIRPRNLNLHANLGKLTKGSWPPSIAFPFIHELTHHWCFDSNVGTCLALTMFRANRTDPTESYEVAKSVFEDITTVDFVLKVLTPWSEGLALFSEFDINVGTSQLISVPLTWLIFALSEHHLVPDINNPEQAKHVNEKLLQWRLTDYCINRKTNVLLPSLSSHRQLEDEAYYNGYLIIKRLYLDLSSKVDIFADKDFFLCFIRAYLFEDLILIELIADASYEDRLLNILQHIDQRIADLYNKDWTLEANLFEIDCNKPMGTRKDPYIAGLGITREEAKKGVVIIEQLFEELNEAHSEDDILYRISEWQKRWILRRNLAIVASESVTLKVTNGRMTVWPDPPDKAFPFLLSGMRALEGINDTNGIVKGWLTYVMVSRSETFAGIVIGIGNEVVFIEPKPAGKKEEVKDFIRACMNDPQLDEQLRNMQNKWMTDYFAEMPKDLASFINNQNQNITIHHERMKKFLLGKYLQDDTIENPLSKADRIWGVFEGDIGMIETFVVMGLLNDYDVLLPSIQDWLKNGGFDPISIFRKSIALSQDKGLDLFWNDHGVFRWII